jgi:hypothetical protein
MSDVTKYSVQSRVSVVIKHSLLSPSISPSQWIRLSSAQGLNRLALFCQKCHVFVTMRSQWIQYMNKRESLNMWEMQGQVFTVLFCLRQCVKYKYKEPESENRHKFTWRQFTSCFPQDIPRSFSSSWILSFGDIRPPTVRKFWEWSLYLLLSLPTLLCLFGSCKNVNLVTDHVAPSAHIPPEHPEDEVRPTSTLVRLLD